MKKRNLTTLMATIVLAGSLFVTLQAPVSAQGKNGANQNCPVASFRQKQDGTGRLNAPGRGDKDGLGTPRLKQDGTGHLNAPGKGNKDGRGTPSLKKDAGGAESKLAPHNRQSLQSQNNVQVLKRNSESFRSGVTGQFKTGGYGMKDGTGPRSQNGTCPVQ